MNEDTPKWYVLSGYDAPICLYPDQLELWGDWPKQGPYRSFDDAESVAIKLKIDEGRMPVETICAEL